MKTHLSPIITSREPYRIPDADKRGVTIQIIIMAAASMVAIAIIAYAITLAGMQGWEAIH